LAQQQTNDERMGVVIADVLKLVEQNPKISFRQLFVLTGHDPQNIWGSLRELQSRRMIESVRVSRKKSGYKIQYAHANR
jgi:hypothetical protein